MATYYLDCERMKYGHSGLFEYCLRLANALQRAAPSDLIVSFLPRSCKRPEISHWTRAPQRFIHRLLPVRGVKADLWHSTHQATPYRPERGTRVLLTVHDLNFLRQPKRARSVTRALRQVQSNVDRADHIVAVSQFAANELRAHVELRDKPVSVIYNGCDVNFDPGFDVPPYRPRSPFCFALGPTAARKNFHVLPRVLCRTDLELVIAGKYKSPYAERIIAEAKRHGVEERVRFLGEISSEAKFWYYRHCEAFLFPSVAEGFGLPPIEAMSFGKPVFLSTHTSLPEIGGSFAYYFESFDPDSMTAVFSKGMDDCRSAVRKQAIVNHAAEFDWDKAAVRYLEVYRSVCGRPIRRS